MTDPTPSTDARQESPEGRDLRALAERADVVSACLVAAESEKSDAWAEVHRLRAEVARLTKEYGELADAVGDATDPNMTHARRLDRVLCETAETAALRARLAETEASLVGLREAGTAFAHKVHGGRPQSTASLAFDAALQSSAALGARVIDEAYEQGARDAAAGKLALPNKADHDRIEAAREEGRAEERKLIAAAVTDWAHSSGLRERPLLTVIEELESYRVRLEKSIRVATAAQDDAVDALATVTAERDEARRERDEARAAEAKTRVMLDDVTGRAYGDDAYIIGLEKRIKLADAIVANNATNTELLTSRDAALAKLAEVEAAAKASRGLAWKYEDGLTRAQVAVYEGMPNGVAILQQRCDEWRTAAGKVLAALSLAPSTALAERDARVRKTALEEAVRLVENERSCRAEHGADPQQVGALTWAVHALGSLASRGGGA